MIAYAFNNRGRAGVADGKALAGDTVQENLTGSGAIQNDVADEDAFFGQEAGGLGRIGDDAPARQSLAEIVVGVAFQFERDTGGNERAEALAGRALESEWIVPSGNPAEPYLRAIWPPSIAPTVRWTLRIAKLPVTGALDSSAGAAFSIRI